MKRKINFTPLIIILLLAFSAGITISLRSTKSQNATSNTNANSSNENKNATSENINSSSTTSSQSQTANKNENSSTNNEQQTTSSYSMPVLMYHYIRDFNDSADQIGINLSVNPTDFAKQLDLIKERGYTTITFADIASGNVPPKSIILTFDDGYGDFYANAYPELKKRNMKAVSYIIVNDIGKDNYMTGNQIVEISKNGIEIGSHTMSHPDLSTASDTKSQKEIIESKSFLENLIGDKVMSLCYPSGKFTNTTEKLVREAGYLYAVTTKSGITKFTDDFALNRYRVNNDTSISSWIKK